MGTIKTKRPTISALRAAARILSNSRKGSRHGAAKKNAAKAKGRAA